MSSFFSFFCEPDLCLEGEEETHKLKRQKSDDNNKSDSNLQRDFTVQLSADSHNNLGYTRLESSKENVKHSNQIERLKEQTTEMTYEMKQIQNQNSELNQKHKDALKTIDNYQNLLDHHSTLQKSMTIKLDGIKNEHDASKKQMQELKLTNAQLIQQTDQLKHEKELLNSELSQCKEQLSKVEEERNNLIANIMDQNRPTVGDGGASNNDANANAAALNSRFMDTLDNYKKESDNKNTEIFKLKEEMGTNEMEFAKYKIENDHKLKVEMEERNKVISETQNKENSQAIDLNSEIERLNSKVSQMESNHNTNNDKNNNISDRLMDQLDEYKRECTSANLLIGKLKEMSNASEMEMTKKQILMEHKCNDYQKMISELNLKMKTLQNEKSEYAHKISELTDTNQNKWKEFDLKWNALNQKYQNCVNEIAHLKAQKEGNDNTRLIDILDNYKQEGDQKTKEIMKLKENMQTQKVEFIEKQTQNTSELMAITQNIQENQKLSEQIEILQTQNDEFQNSEKTWIDKESELNAKMSEYQTKYDECTNDIAALTTEKQKLSEYNSSLLEQLSASLNEKEMYRVQLENMIEKEENDKMDLFQNLDKDKLNLTLRADETTITGDRLTEFLGQSTPVVQLENMIEMTYQTSGDDDDDDGEDGAMSEEELLEIQRRKSNSKSKVVKRGSLFNTMEIAQMESDMTAELSALKQMNNENINKTNHKKNNSNLFRLRSIKNWKEEDVTKEKDDMQEMLTHLVTNQSHSASIDAKEHMQRLMEDKTAISVERVDFFSQPASTLKLKNMIDKAYHTSGDEDDDNDGDSDSVVSDQDIKEIEKRKGSHPNLFKSRSSGEWNSSDLKKEETQMQMELNNLKGDANDNIASSNHVRNNSHLFRMRSSDKWDLDDVTKEKDEMQDMMLHLAKNQRSSV